MAEIFSSKHSDVEFVRSYTTRPRRSDNDTTHIFVSDEKFQKLLDNNKFIDIYNGFGYSYGLPKSENNNQLILIRAPLVEKLRLLYPNSTVIALEAPISILMNRILIRGDTQRANKVELEKEIYAGREVADIIIKTDKPIMNCVNQLEEVVNKL